MTSDSFSVRGIISHSSVRSLTNATYLQRLNLSREDAFQLFPQARRTLEPAFAICLESLGTRGRSILLRYKSAREDPLSASKAPRKSSGRSFSSVCLRWASGTLDPLKGGTICAAPTEFPSAIVYGLIGGSKRLFLSRRRRGLETLHCDTRALKWTSVFRL